MHNWKWTNLSKMAGLNINRRQRSSDKEHNLSSFSPSAVVLPAFYSLLHRLWNKRNYSTLISEMFFTFLREKLFEKNFSRWMCSKPRCQLQEKGGILARNSHSFWLEVSFFSHMKKHRSRFWLDVSFFSRMKTIFRSSDWLELVCVRKFLSM